MQQGAPEMLHHEDQELGRHLGDLWGDREVGRSPVAEREVVSDSNHIDAMRKVLVSLSPDILLERC
jgi:hypothetical protein